MKDMLNEHEKMKRKSRNKSPVSGISNAEPRQAGPLPTTRGNPRDKDKSLNPRRTIKRSSKQSHRTKAQQISEREKENEKIHNLMLS